MAATTNWICSAALMQASISWGSLHSRPALPAASEFGAVVVTWNPMELAMNSETRRDDLWVQLAVVWNVLDPEELSALQAESECRSQPIEVLLKAKEDYSKDDLDALEWMVDRMSTGQGATDANSLSTLNGLTDVIAPDTEDARTIDVPLHQSSSSPGDRASARYQRHRLHAKGGVGQVWLARDRTIQRNVALKELRPDRGNSEQHRERFLLEAQVTGQLEHPGVVPVYELNSSGTSPCYTMRFIQGKTLQQAINDYHKRLRDTKAEPLELIHLLTAFVSICNTVEYAHSRSVIHRDLKGHNVVVGDFGEVIVLDWGLAVCKQSSVPAVRMDNEPVSAESSTATTMGTIVGTPSYMSPEQARGDIDRIGPASDVYSLGVILYEILAGVLPFSGKSQDELLQKVIHDEPPPPNSFLPRAPTSLSAICLKALSKQPEERYASARELSEEVQRYLADEPVDAKREALPTRIARWGRKHRTFVTSAAAMLIVAVIGLAIGNRLLVNANQAITLQREHALQAEQQARLNGERAERNFLRALAAVNDSLTKVSQSKLLNVPGMHILRRELLTDALQYYQEFANEDADNHRLHSEIANAHYAIGRIHSELGEMNLARESVQHALALSGENHMNGLQLANYESQLGRIDEITGKLSDALHHYQNATGHLETYLTRRPDSFEANSDLGSNFLALAQLFHRSQNIQEARQAISKSADIFIEQTKQYPEHLRVACRTAKALTFRGVLERESGELETSTASFASAIDRLQNFGETDRDDMELRNVLSSCFHSQGLSFRRLEEFDNAKSALSKAIDVRITLTHDFPTVPETWSELAASYNSLGVLHWQLEEDQKALECYRLAAQQQNRLVDLYHDVPLYRSDLASSFNNIAMIHRQHGDFSDALQAYDQCISIRKQLAADSPQFVPNQVALASAYRNVGRVFQDQREFESMLHWCDQSVAVLNQLHDRIGDDPRVRFYLRRGHWDRADALQELTRFAEAAEAWSTTWEYDDGKEKDYIAMQRARCRTLSGDYRQAVSDAQQLAESELDGETTYGVACVMALSVTSLASDSKLSESESTQLAQDYGMRAVELLLLAKQRAYFTDKENILWLAEDPDLNSLRKRQDYQSFVVELSNPQD